MSAATVVNGDVSKTTRSKSNIDNTLTSVEGISDTSSLELEAIGEEIKKPIILGTSIHNEKMGKSPHPHHGKNGSLGKSGKIIIVPHIVASDFAISVAESNKCNLSV